MPQDLRQLSEARSQGILIELWRFIGHTKKWWLTPILLMMLLLGGLIIAGGSGAAPFIYTLFGDQKSSACVRMNSAVVGCIASDQ